MEYNGRVSKMGVITLEHGSGGLATISLIKEMILSKINNPYLIPLDDSADLPLPKGQRLAFTSDSYVVDPIFFPGGDIGSLSVYGTVNDLTMQGATPLYLSLALILEEGFPFESLERILCSVAQAASKANVMVVTGDTKVVKKGQADKLFVTTSGIGVIPAGVNVSVSNARPGDKVLINGTIGDHGTAVMMAREELNMVFPVSSDTGPLNTLFLGLDELRFQIRALKDPTRGGLATALNEIAHASGVAIEVEETKLPIRREVEHICELLGLDPLYLANEGKMVAIVRKGKEEEVLKSLRAHPMGEQSAVIGEVKEGPPGLVTLKTRIGGTRILPVLRGMQLPRIC